MSTVARRGPAARLLWGPASPQLEAHATQLRRLADHRALLRVQHRDRLLLQGPRGQEHRGVLPLGPQCPLVARRDVHGGDDVRRRHAPGRHRIRRAQRHRRQLAVVVFRGERHAHRVLLRAAVAARRRDDRRRVCRDPLRGETRRLPARLPGAVPRHPDQLHHPGLGQSGNGQDPAADLRGREVRSPGDRARHDLPHVRDLDAVRVVGRAGHRRVPVRGQDEHGDHPGRVRGPGGGRHRRLEDEARRQRPG